jgi:hypothetical protein
MLVRTIGRLELPDLDVVLGSEAALAGIEDAHVRLLGYLRQLWVELRIVGELLYDQQLVDDEADEDVPFAIPSAQLVGVDVVTDPRVPRQPFCETAVEPLAVGLVPHRNRSLPAPA